ncbi:MucR family transcriptional regulator [Methylobacterium sp. E-041]|uniref:MucR family transcriptional regulator n=1 Tax=Methylobacterium sp. E-041 TaxID=2836573 RepID=UPI001FBAEB7E|nr:MucR family transcriptional regulator [Methylobacterium sp. E-041]MCJ2104733.1 MucR family transcriptional regulator [Methylobacterium sp. E-041]
MNAQTSIDTAATTPLLAAAQSRQDLAAGIVAAYVRGNRIPVADLPGLIRSVDGALRKLADPEPEVLIVRPTEAEIRTSIRPDAITSFEDGKPYKALRRHLTIRGLTPEDYRRKWGLPVDYPLVAATYSARRSEISAEIGRKLHDAAYARRDAAAPALADAEA